MRRSYSYLALGDSYTVGEGLPNKDNWPMQLKAILAQKNLELEPVDILATTGWTTSDLLKAMDEEQQTRHDLVSLLIGVNNQYQGLDFKIFCHEFDELLNRARELVSTTSGLFVVSIPDYGTTPFGAQKELAIAEELAKYNRYISSRCTDLNIKHIDITPLSRKLSSDPGNLIEDELHPNRAQYKEWARHISAPLFEELVKP